jgi:iron complex transport system substrate-binding protein
MRVASLLPSATEIVCALGLRERLVLRSQVVVVMPCGFTLHRTRQESHLLTRLPGWMELPAAKEGRVALAHGHHFFNRPGPRIAESLEILSEIFHPSVPGYGHRGSAWDWMEA